MALAIPRLTARRSSGALWLTLGFLLGFWAPSFGAEDASHAADTVEDALHAAAEHHAEGHDDHHDDHGSHGDDHGGGSHGGHGGHGGHSFEQLPKPLALYEALEAEKGIETLFGVLQHRIEMHPFNLVATIVFLLAVLHTFMASTFLKWAHAAEHEHAEKIKREGRTAAQKQFANAKDDTSFKATVFHFLGEVEAIFGLWCVPLIIAIFSFYDWNAVTGYLDFTVHYTEPMFVVVIMAIASTRPVLKFSEQVLGQVAHFGGRKPSAWWLAILTIAPLLGSFITEPAAMTIAALLLGQQFYRHEPSNKFKYATLGLLFVNISVGGTLTHFAAPPVLMVAGTWGWDIGFMFIHFGWKAALGIVIANTIYFFIFKQDFAALDAKVAGAAGAEKELPEEPIPFWITLVILGFLGWTVFTLHHPPLFIAGFLFFLAFVKATATHQDDVSIKGPLLVGFFLAGLVTHGALQQWWIAPVLSRLGDFPLFAGATILTAFNDNAAITFLASQVPAFAPGQEGATMLEYAVVSGAVTGGGLTVIANAPNPAGQSLLQGFFKGGVSPLYLLLGAIIPTLVMAVCFRLLPF